MASIGAADDVTWPSGGGNSDAHSLLTLGRVGRTRDQPFTEQLEHPVLEQPDLDHALISGPATRLKVDTPGKRCPRSQIVDSHNVSSHQC